MHQSDDRRLCAGRPARGVVAGLLRGTPPTLLYAVLRMENSALLRGTALMLILLGALMAVSRKLAFEDG